MNFALTRYRLGEPIPTTRFAREKGNHGERVWFVRLGKSGLTLRTWKGSR